VIKMGQAATKTYDLKQTTGRFNAHADKFTPDQLAYVKEELKDHLHYFGYTNGG
jgi:hypothetical protein